MRVCSLSRQCLRVLFTSTIFVCFLLGWFIGTVALVFDKNKLISTDNKSWIFLHLLLNLFFALIFLPYLFQLNPNPSFLRTIKLLQILLRISFLPIRPNKYLDHTILVNPNILYFHINLDPMRFQTFKSTGYLSLYPFHFCTGVLSQVILDGIVEVLVEKVHSLIFFEHLEQFHQIRTIDTFVIFAKLLDIILLTLTAHLNNILNLRMIRFLLTLERINPILYMIYDLHLLFVIIPQSKRFKMIVPFYTPEEFISI